MKINDRILGGITALGLAATLGVGGVIFASGVSAAPAGVTETVAPLDVPSDAPNGIAAEQEAEAAAAVEAARVAAEQAAAAEAARIAAEQAAAAEAQRIAAEQAASDDAETYEADEPSGPAPAPAPEPEYTGPLPGTQTHSICQVLEDGTQIPCQ